MKKRFPFSIELISTFLAVAESKSISAASKLLYVSQPSVTGQIKRLEDELDISLFERSVNGTNLTPAGKKFYEFACKIRNLVNNVASELNIEEEASGIIKVAASTTISDHILPSLITSFYQQNPKIKISLLVRNSDEVLNLVRNKEVDLGMVEGLARSRALILEKFMSDEIVPIASVKIVQQITKVEDLLNFPLLIRESGSGTRKIVEKLLRKTGISLNQFSSVIELGSSNAIKGAVEKGLGIGLISITAIKDELKTNKLTLLDLEGFRIERSFSLVNPPQGLNNITKEFIRFIKNQEFS